MPLDFTPTSVVKSAKRTYTAPITDAQTFDDAVAALKAEDNPLGATEYMTAGETVPGVSTASEYYKATIEYTDTLGETLGTIVITAPTRTAYCCRKPQHRKGQLERPPQNPRPNRRNLLPQLHQKRPQNHLLRKRRHPHQG